jgi:hypothetical protein
MPTAQAIAILFELSDISASTPRLQARSWRAHLRELFMTAIKKAALKKSILQI